MTFDYFGMKHVTTILYFVYSLCLFYPTTCDSLKPEQIHISYGVDPMHMAVTWSTMEGTVSTVCQYGIYNVSENKASGYTFRFRQNTLVSHYQYIHKVVLNNLKPRTKYKYICGDGDNMSDMNTFTSMNTDPTYAPAFAVFGDMGSTNASTLPRIEKDFNSSLFETILHVGDFAYDMNTDEGRNGDIFMRNIEPIAARVPYMTSPGNHEQAYNFSNYKARFTMPGDELGDKMYYSFDIGPAHIISLSTELYFFYSYGLKQVPQQYKWLEQDLIKANKNRDKRPWIITLGHRPMYCSDLDKDDCTFNASTVRVGVPFLHLWGLEDLFYKQGVDLMIWAHEHNYERLWPLYNGKVMNGTKGAYVNPPAPVHIITGSAGSSEGHTSFRNSTEIPYWSAFRNKDFGYTRMKVFNKTHLQIEQLSDPKNGAVIDKFWYVQENHGPRN